MAQKYKNTESSMFNKRDKKTIYVKLKIQALKFFLLVSKYLSFR